MRRERREGDLRVRGLGLRARFVAILTAALAPILAVAGLVLYTSFVRLADGSRELSLREAVRFSQKERPYEELADVVRDKHGVERRTVVYGPRGEGRATLYRYRPKDPLPGEGPFTLVVPPVGGFRADVLGLIVGVLLLVLLAGAGAALWVARQVSRPIHRLIDDVRQIAKGDLAHRTHAVGQGEVELLARSIDRMTRELDQAQEAQIELEVRRRELDLASGVREALLPLATPLIENYDLGGAFLSSDRFGGDFHDFIELSDGRIGLLVCEVGGRGVPAALIGATARSYLRSELQREPDPGQALKRVNRWLASDVRRGMFVTALYCLVDPGDGTAQVACAGHKIPLLRYAAEDASLRVVHPEGIALGFDRGAVFDRRLEVVTTPVQPGDRLVLANSVPVRLENSHGEELGETRFYARVKRHAPLDTGSFLKALRRDLERYAGETGLGGDVSLVTIARLH